MTDAPDFTRRIAEFATATACLPDPVMQRAKIHFADTVACIYAGAASKPARHVARLYREADPGPAGITVPGLGKWPDGAAAALITGVCAHAEDFDDTSSHSMSGHPSAPVVSAVLATAGHMVNVAQPGDTPLTGKDMLRAYAIGVEIACKLGKSIVPHHARQGWHTMSTLGTIAAAAACAALRGLDLDATRRAIGIASSLAGGILGNTGTMVKSLHCGHASWAGYTAANLAADAYTARDDILERPGGFIDVFGGTAKPDSTAIASLGAPWDFVSPGIEIKLYPSCACTHPAIAGALEIVSDPQFNPASIEKIQCWMSSDCASYLSCHDPRTAIEGKFSIEYTVACALVRKRVTLADFTDSAVTAEDVAGFMRMISTCIREPSGQEPDIELFLKDGRVVSSPLRGNGASIVDWPQIAQKFDDCSAGFLTPARRAEILEALRKLDHVNAATFLLQLRPEQVDPARQHLEAVSDHG